MVFSATIRSTSCARQAGMALEAYFRLPDGKQSCSPFDGECKESLTVWASGVCVTVTRPAIPFRTVCEDCEKNRTHYNGRQTSRTGQQQTLAALNERVVSNIVFACSQAQQKARAMFRFTSDFKLRSTEADPTRLDEMQSCYKLSTGPQCIGFWVFFAAYHRD